ncbi:MAG: phytanoyl-CoA dioxygenase family protein [Acidimicrobiales bacterium]
MSVRDLAYTSAAGRLVLAPIAGWGYRRSAVAGATPRASYGAMRKLYGCASPGPWERLVARAAGEHPLLDIPADADGLAAGQVDEVVAGLRAHGYHVLPERLGPAVCDELEAVARAATCTMIGGPGDGGRARFDEAAPQSVRYDVPEADAVASPAAQRLIADLSLLAVAQGYLGATPVQDLVAMWWSAAIGEEASSAAAQLFHFDLDRLRFLKVFVFLTDVDEHNGPHVYVEGSHRDRPPEMRRDGRHSDAEVEAAYPGRSRVLTGPRGLPGRHHRHAQGQGLERGHRLVFQLEYATSLFGAPFTCSRWPALSTSWPPPLPGTPGRSSGSTPSGDGGR